MGRVVIHCEPRIAWHSRFAYTLRTGLKVLGIKADTSTSRQRESDFAVLLGTTLWRRIEDDGNWLLVDRASFGDPHYVQLVWNGHGRRGDHCVPTDLGDRWKTISPDYRPWRRGGEHVVLCGQTEPYSPHYRSLDDWYFTVKNATHFRGHPAGTNPTGLPTWRYWFGVSRAITLNSSVAVDAVLEGVPTVTMDEGAMAWDVTSHDPDTSITPPREPWLQWLAWTQWHYDEIAAGEPIRHLFERV